MPTTTKFSTKGLRNGFPFCAGKVDVSGFDYWVTLGGTQKGNSPTQEQIGLSRENACKLYWNLYRVNGTYWPANINGVEFKIDFTDAASNEHQIFNFFDAVYKAEMAIPVNRLCNVKRLLDNSDEFNPEEAYFEIGVPYAKFAMPNGLSSNFYGDIGIKPPQSPVISQGTPIVRMYDGVTSDEDNFVGYGIASNWTKLVTDFSDYYFDDVGSGINGAYLGVPPDAWVCLLSYANTGQNGDGTPNPIGYGNIPIAVERVNTGESIPVVVCIYTLGDGFGGIPNAITSVETRTSKYEDSTNPTYAEGIQIDSVEFYTY